MNDLIQLSELGEIITGNTPSTSDNANYESDDILFVKPSDISNDRISYIENTENYISNYAKEKARVVPSDTVFCTCIGIIGKVGIATKDSAFNQQINAIIPDKNKVTSDYLAYALMAKRNYMQVKANAAVVPIINKSQFAELKIKYVSLEEQRCITDKFQLIDSLIAKREKQIETIEYLVKSRFVEMFGDNTYPKVKSAEICDFITKGTTPASKDILPSEEEDTIPYLKVYNLSFTGDLLFRQEPQYISREIHEGKLARSKVYPNDILMNIVGPPLGKFALVTDEYSEWNINQAIAIFRAKERILPKFLLSALMQEKVIQPFIDQAVGVRQLNISLEQCRNLELILPPLEEQKKYVSFIEQVDKSKLAVQQSIETLQTLKAKLMQDYFS